MAEIVDDDEGYSEPDRPDGLDAKGGGSVHERLWQGWIARIVEQDQQALAELYDALVGRVYGLALRITRQVQLAEEVVEDTFWQVWRQAPRFDPERGTAMAWIMAIARSRALDALRGKDPAECDSDPWSLAGIPVAVQSDPLEDRKSVV